MSESAALAMVPPIIGVIVYGTGLISAVAGACIKMIPSGNNQESVYATTVVTFVWIWTTIIYWVIESYKSDKRKLAIEIEICRVNREKVLGKYATED